MTREQELRRRMTVYYTGDPARIQHFLKVYEFSLMIGVEEGLSGKELEILGAAALVHDIGIRPAEEKYGSCDGRLQEQEGPAEAEKMMAAVGYPQEVIARVSYLVGHHHTYTQIDGADYQILVEADFLVNLYEGESSRKTIYNTYRKIFRTEAGRRLCRIQFALEESGGADLQDAGPGAREDGLS